MVCCGCLDFLELAINTFSSDPGSLNVVTQQSRMFQKMRQLAMFFRIFFSSSFTPVADAHKLNMLLRQKFPYRFFLSGEFSHISNL